MRDEDSIGKVLRDADHGSIGYWRCVGFTCDNCPAKVGGKRPYELYGVESCIEAKFADAERRIRELVPDADALRGVADRLERAAGGDGLAACSWFGCVGDCSKCPAFEQREKCSAAMAREVAREIRKALHDAPDDAPESAQEAVCGPEADGPGQVPGSGVADAQNALELPIVRAQRDAARADLAEARAEVDGLRAEVGRLTADRDADRAAVLAKLESLKDTMENLTSDMSLTGYEYAKKFGFYCTALDYQSLDCAMLAHLRWRRDALRGCTMASREPESARDMAWAQMQNGFPVTVEHVETGALPRGGDVCHTDTNVCASGSSESVVVEKLVYRYAENGGIGLAKSSETVFRHEMPFDEFKASEWWVPYLERTRRLDFDSSWMESFRGEVDGGGRCAEVEFSHPESEKVWWCSSPVLTSRVHRYEVYVTDELVSANRDGTVLFEAAYDEIADALATVEAMHERGVFIDDDGTVTVMAVRHGE